MHEAKATDIMRTVHDYIKTVEGSLRAGAGAGAGSGNQKLGIELNSDGYPIAPCPPSWEKTTKTDLEKLYRSYISIHYRTFLDEFFSAGSEYKFPIGLATGIKDRQPPFTRIAKKQSEFVLSKYIPRGLTLQDPRTMLRGDIIKLFQHIGNRETSHGIKDAFRFKAVLSSRKEGSLGEVKYQETATHPAMNIMGPNDTATNNTANIEPAHTAHTAQALPSAPNHTAYMDPADPAEALPTAPERTTETSAMARNRPRPKPKPKNRAQNSNVIDTQATPDPTPQLVLERGFQWDSQIDLDPSLDPAFDFPATNDELLPVWGIVSSSPASAFMSPHLAFNPPVNTNDPAPAFTSHTEQAFNPPVNTNNQASAPAPAFTSHTDQLFSLGSSLITAPATTSLHPAPPARSPRRKGKNADVLAREEAATLIAKNKKRR